MHQLTKTSVWRFENNYLNILLYLQWLFYKANVKWKVKMLSLVIRKEELKLDSVRAKMEIVSHANS